MRSFLITGANSGVGLALTHALAARKQHVIMAVRDAGRGETARAEVLKQHPGALLQLELLDLTDLRSVRALGEKDLGVDVVINNAGIACEPKALDSSRKSAFGVCVQPVSATPLVVYRLAFGSPRSFADVD